MSGRGGSVPLQQSGIGQSGMGRDEALTPAEGRPSKGETVRIDERSGPFDLVQDRR